jgi:hypothetical protein
MHWVDDFFAAALCRTRFWVTQAVTDGIADLDKSRRQILLKRLERYAKNGFWNYESREGPVKPEWRSAYRIGHADDLFRIIGFYEDDGKANFIAIDCFLKRGQDLSRAQRNRIDAVADVKASGDWKRRTPGGTHLRLT